MSILIVGESPYNLTSNGKIISDLVRSLKKDNLEVFCASWAYDKSWFLPDDDGYWYETKDEGKICKIYPFVNSADKSITQIYETMKKVKPKVVISVGDFDRTSFISHIKAIYPDLFKWVAVMTIESGPIPEEYAEAFDMMDYVICTNSDGCKFIEEISNTDCEFIRYGQSFLPEIKASELDVFRITNISRNTDSSNLAVFIRAIGNIKKKNPTFNIEGYLHTNLYDKGFYDVESLVAKYSMGCVRLPEHFVSVNDGISEEDLGDIYSSTDMIVDSSSCSATGLTLLEGMSFGCIPLCSGKNAFADILDNIDLSLSYYLRVDSTEFIARQEKFNYILSVEGLMNKIEYWYNIKRYSKKLFESYRRIVQEEALKYSNQNFCTKVKDAIIKVRNRNSILTVKEF